MRITAVEALYAPRATPLEPPPWWVCTPRDVFRPRFAPTDLPPSVDEVVVRVRTDEGIEGLGGVGHGSPAAKVVIDHHLAPLVIGQSPFDLEYLWQTMYRTSVSYGRKGLVIEAISGIDIALWDIVGKATGQPVYNLLGGRVKDRIRAYASRSCALEDLDTLEAEARGYVDAGYTALKFRFGYGPGDGRVGMGRNCEIAAAVRRGAGPGVDVMADAYMGWDVQYAIKMIRLLEEFDLAWVEEPVMPDHLDGYAQIRAGVNTPIAGGEHEFTRWGFRDLLVKGAVDILQPDINRVGGITEAAKIFALASAFDVPVIPHGDGAHVAHLITANTNAPLIENAVTLDLPSVPRHVVESYAEHGYVQPLIVGGLSYDHGYATVGSEPGLGVRLDEEELAARARLSAADAHAD